MATIVSHSPAVVPEGHPTGTHADVTRDVVATLGPASRGYVLLLLGAVALFLIGILTFLILIKDGLGHAGYNPPIFWSVYITTFVFWVGIGHAGTLISAILFLFRSPWRTVVYRATEAMTVFAVMTAGLFPIIHIGRQWFFYWLLPYPNQRFLWPNFKSPLIWDVFAIGTYLTVSTTFLVVGLIPDIAAVRDTVGGWRSKVYQMFAIGWKGTDNQWRHYSRAYLYLAALATPLVLSVHSVVSWDFAMSIQPGWHTTIFPPYFVAGAILSGCAMVYNLLILVRYMFRLEKFILPSHLDACLRLTLLTSTIVSYAYAIEFFVAWYSGNPYEWAIFEKRAIGPYAFYFWTMTFCNCVFPLAFWSKKVRNNIPAAWLICILINVG